ncbi:bun, partial [Drosophila busckii]
HTSHSVGHAATTGTATAAAAAAAGAGAGGATSTATAAAASTGGGGGGGNRKPKTTSSFQITSVTVGHAKLHNAGGDTGDESADDIDESHTDDNSRITDLENETPSMSEDTYSKEEVYYANNALSTTAPVIPTSSQYGLVVVDPINPATLGLGQTIQNVQVNVSDNIINVVSAAVTPGGSKKKQEELKETQHRSERFKVVKIESTEPFKRGRWMCMDYLDHSSVGAANNNEKTGNAETAGGATNQEGEAAPKTTQSMILPPSIASASASASATPNGSRKRAFSNPHIASVPLLAPDGRRLQPHLYYYDQSRSGRSSFCVNESLWPGAAATASDSDLYSTPNALEEDSEEATDQFSPTLYSRLTTAPASASRAIPIPHASSSAGNSPQHHYNHHQHHYLPQRHQSLQQQQLQPQRSLSTGAATGAAAAAAAVGFMAFSASPTGFVHAYSPFYGSSPDTLCSPVAGGGGGGAAHISFSYDPSFGPGIHRLQVPPEVANRRPRSPLDCATVMAVN